MSSTASNSTKMDDPYKTPFRVLICGGREHYDSNAIRLTLAGYKMKYGDRLEVIHGDARGADTAADIICRSLGIRVRAFPADWRGHGKAAGPIRNKLMLSERPSVVHAFKDHFNYALNRGGTENMVKIALEADVPVRVHDQGESVRVERTQWGCRPWPAESERDLSGAVGVAQSDRIRPE